VTDPTKSVDAAPANPSRHPALHRLILIGRVVVFVLVLAGVGYAGVVEWDSVRDTIRALSWKSLVGAQLAVVLGMFAAVKVWQHLLAAMGTRVRYRAAAQVNLVGQLGKYLPGSVWAFVLQAQLGKRYKIPRARSLVALLLSAGITSVTALTLAVLAAEPLSHEWGGLAWLLVLGPLSLVTVYPPVLTRIANVALKLLQRPPFVVHFAGIEILRALVWSFTSWLLFGAQLWLLTGSIAKQSLTGYTITTGAFALAMSAGFLAFILPSGIGVREAVIVGGLAPLAAAGPALAMALTSRLLFTIADVATASAALLATRLTLRHEAGHAVTVHQPGVPADDNASQDSR
jgi:uncharacterized membrane protein YbhN (UPF0104 family)